MAQLTLSATPCKLASMDEEMKYDIANKISISGSGKFNGMIMPEVLLDTI
jgi:hypothetical protein